jgi:hypothetical protein
MKKLKIEDTHMKKLKIEDTITKKNLKLKTLSHEKA